MKTNCWVERRKERTGPLSIKHQVMRKRNIYEQTHFIDNQRTLGVIFAGRDDRKEVPII